MAPTVLAGAECRREHMRPPGAPSWHAPPGFDDSPAAAGSEFQRPRERVGRRSQGRQRMFATTIDAPDDVDAALRAVHSPEKTPNLPHCLASDLPVPKTFKEAVQSPRTQNCGQIPLVESFFACLV